MSLYRIDLLQNRKKQFDTKHNHEVARAANKQVCLDQICFTITHIGITFTQEQSGCYWFILEYNSL